jgi:hypothetical protein
VTARTFEHDRDRSAQEVAEPVCLLAKEPSGFHSQAFEGSHRNLEASPRELVLPTRRRSPRPRPPQARSTQPCGRSGLRRVGPPMTRAAGFRPRTHQKQEATATTGAAEVYRAPRDPPPGSIRDIPRHPPRRAPARKGAEPGPREPRPFPTIGRILPGLPVHRRTDSGARSPAKLAPEVVRPSSRASGRAARR